MYKCIRPIWLCLLIYLFFPVCCRKATNPNGSSSKSSTSQASTIQATPLDCPGKERRNWGLAEIHFAEEDSRKTWHWIILSCGIADQNFVKSTPRLTYTRCHSVLVLFTSLEEWRQRLRLTIHPPHLTQGQRIQIEKEMLSLVVISTLTHSTF